jgi:hypothetical protein
MLKEDKLSLLVLDQYKLRELKLKIDYQMRILAIQYNRLGFTNKQIAETFNKAGLRTPKSNKLFNHQAVAQLIKKGTGHE